MTLIVYERKSKSDIINDLIVFSKKLKFPYKLVINYKNIESL
jgi:hypothetical protein